MALQTETAKNELKTLLTDMRTRTEVSDDEYADKLIALIAKLIKSGTIVYQAGLIAPSGGGAVTGVFNGQIE